MFVFTHQNTRAVSVPVTHTYNTWNDRKSQLGRPLRDPRALLQLLWPNVVVVVVVIRDGNHTRARPEISTRCSGPRYTLPHKSWPALDCCSTVPFSNKCPVGLNIHVYRALFLLPQRLGDFPGATVGKCDFRFCFPTVTRPSLFQALFQCYFEILPRLLMYTIRALTFDFQTETVRFRRGPMNKEYFSQYVSPFTSYNSL